MEGEAIGMEKGALSKAREAALSMLDDGMSVEVISKYTSLSVDEISTLRG